MSREYDGERGAPKPRACPFCGEVVETHLPAHMRDCGGEQA